VVVICVLISCDRGCTSRRLVVVIVVVVVVVTNSSSGSCYGYACINCR
jgi:hypothetical protein